MKLRNEEQICTSELIKYTLRASLHLSIVPLPFPAFQYVLVLTFSFGCSLLIGANFSVLFRRRGRVPANNQSSTLSTKPVPKADTSSEIACYRHRVSLHIIASKHRNERKYVEHRAVIGA